MRRLVGHLEHVALVNLMVGHRLLDIRREDIEIITDTGEKKMAYAETLPVELTNKSSIVQVVLYQGINRQIRKMFAKLGFEVVVLKRIQHAIITLEGMKKGQLKLIKPKQVKQLKSYLEKIQQQSENA